MRKSLVLSAALAILAFAVPSAAHPGHGTSRAYVVFWKGVLPKTGIHSQAKVEDTAIWRQAFISIYPILGSQLPVLHP